MTILIQPLDSSGQPTDKAFESDFESFLRFNPEVDREDIEFDLNHGFPYAVGGGAAGCFKITKIRD